MENGFLIKIGFFEEKREKRGFLGNRRMVVEGFGIMMILFVKKEKEQEREYITYVITLCSSM